MSSWSRRARINVKVLIILLVIMAALGTSLLAARHIRRNILSEMSLRAGNTAFENEDWPAAYRHFQECLGRNPDDLEILKKYAEARMHIRPLDAGAIGGAIAAYRRIIQLDPLDETAYDQLARLYAYIGNLDELRYIAKKRIGNNVPEDRKARLWLYRALVGLDQMDDANEVELDRFKKDLDTVTGKPDEYVQACVLMSEIILADDSDQARADRAESALEFLDKAVAGVPDSAEARVHRARFYRGWAGVPGIEEEAKVEMLAAARKDLIAADGFGTQNPRLRLSLCAEWIAHGDLGRADAELQAAESLPQETLEEHFLDLNDWTVARFVLASELARQKEATTEGASLADEVLTALKERRHRAQVLPSAIVFYLADANVAEARKCVDEYLDIMYTRELKAETQLRLAYLQALVARAEGKPHDVIDILQPAVARDASHPDLWLLLAEAYDRTNQTRRAVDAMLAYRRSRPEDPQMTLRLARGYFRLQDWRKAFETAQIAESLNPTDIAAKLLRLEADIHLAARQRDRADTAKLGRLSTELDAMGQEHPDRGEIHRLRAIIAGYLEQPDKAESELNLAIEECEEPLKAEMQLVAYYRQTGRMADAIKVCRMACERHAEVAGPWLSLSDLHSADANDDAARSCLREGLNNVTDKLGKRSLSIGLALLELTRGDRAVGIDILNKLAAQDEREVRARSLLLGLREVRKDQAAAEKLVRELRKAEGESGLLWRQHQASLWLASDAWRSKQQDITDRLQYCIDSDPELSAPVLLLVDMYERMEDFSRVEDICRQALARNPSAAAVADRLLTLLERQGRFPEAEQVLQQIEADPRVASAWQVRMALRTGDLSQAIDELKLRVADDDQDAESRIQLARLLYQQNGDAERAFAYLNEAEATASGSMALTAARVSILQAEGQAEEAQRILDDYVKESDDFNAYWMRAAYLTVESEFERAEMDYRKLTTFAEQGAVGYELLSDFYGRNGRIDEAAAALEEALSAYPEDLNLKRKLMKTLFLRGRPEDRLRAVEILTSFEEQLPQDPELMRIRAALVLEERTPESRERARALLENAVKLEPTALDGHLMLIDVAMKQKEYEAARDLAIRATGSHPDNPDLLSARSKAELALENTDMAAHLAQLVLQEDPNNVAAMVVLADVHRLGGDMERSREWIERAEQLDPNDRAVFGARCLWLGSKKRYEELAEICSTFLSAKEQNLSKVLTVAAILSRSDSIGFKKEGVKLFEHALTLSPTAIDANLGLASTLYQVGDAERAKAIYLELHEQYPDNMQVLNDLAWILQEHDHRYAEALELANKGLNLAPDNPHLLDTRGTILINVPDRLTDARTDFETLEQLLPADSPQQAKTLLQLGRICAKLSDLVQARQHLEHALKIDRKIDVFTTDERSEIARIIERSAMQAVSK